LTTKKYILNGFVTYAQDVATVIRTLIPENSTFALFGHSTGALVNLIFQQRYASEFSNFQPIPNDLYPMVENLSDSNELKMVMVFFMELFRDELTGAPTTNCLKNALKEGENFAKNGLVNRSLVIESPKELDQVVITQGANFWENRGADYQQIAGAHDLLWSNCGADVEASSIEFFNSIFN
jgi:hypothetical protein